MTLYPQLERTLARTEVAIGSARRVLLDELASFVRARLDADAPVRLVFICTHNSRRSHMAAIWARAAAYRAGFPGVATFSGGTEVTAFQPRAIEALKRAGFGIEGDDRSTNPVMRVRYSKNAGDIDCFSKRFDHPVNPTADFCAVMTCTSADEACPLVPGAAKRIALPYSDPGDADGTPEEARSYDACCRIIGGEMNEVFQKVRHG